MEENIRELEELIESVREQKLNPNLANRIEILIKGYRELEKWKREKGCSIQEVYELFIPKSKIKEIKEKNEKKIDEMRPYRHQGPFDFGVLNGIDECCRMLLENK